MRIFNRKKKLINNTSGEFFFLSIMFFEKIIEWTGPLGSKKPYHTLQQQKGPREGRPGKNTAWR